MSSRSTLREILVVVAAATCGLPVPSNGQEAFFYYAAPTDTMTAHFSAVHLFGFVRPRADTTVQALPSYRAVLLDSPSKISTFRSFAAPNALETYDSLHTDTRVKQTADRLTSLAGDAVGLHYLLIDDRNGLDEEDPYFPTRFDTTEDKYYVVPGTRIWHVEGHDYVSEIKLPEHWSGIIANRPGGWWAWEAQILHQISHSQFLPDPRYGMNVWGSRAIALGPDMPVWAGELLGDQQIAMDEGLADFWGLVHNIVAAPQDLIDFCNEVRPRFLLGSLSYLASVPAVWDAEPHTVDTALSGLVSDLPDGFFDQPFPDSTRYELRKYMWRAVPGAYVLNSQIMNTAFLYLFYWYAFDDHDVGYSVILDAARELTPPSVTNRYPAYLANLMANRMEDYARSNRQAPASGAKLRSSMLVYALYDLVTHFGIPEADLRRELQRNFPPARPKAFDQYWRHREAVKKLADPYIDGFVYDIDKAAVELATYFSQPETIIR